MNDEVKQGETIQSAEQQESERATAAQVTQRDPGPPAAPADERRDGAAAQQPAQTTSESATSQDAEDAAAERSAATGETPSDPQAGDDENPEFRELQEALAEGRDLSTELEAPAAGQGGGTSDSIAAGVRFERDPNARDPQAGFDPDYSPPPLPDPTADTNLVAEAVVPPPPPDNGVAIGGLTPAVEGGDVSVNEANLSDGSAPNPPALTQTGSFTVSAPDGLGSLTLGGVLVLDANGLTGNPVTTPLGNTLVVTGYDPETGTVTYEYTLGDNESHPQGQGTNDLFDNLPVVLTDSDGDTTEEVLAVRVIDDIPDAISDIDEVGTGGSTGGNVFTGTDDDALDRVEADVPGADRTGSPITGVIAGDHLDAPITDGSGVGAVINGQFGTLVLNADGSYVYTANGGLTSNQTEVFTYTLTDGDGDADTATLTITLGDDEPTLNVPVAGEAGTEVFEAGLPARDVGDGPEPAGSAAASDSETTAGTITFTPGDTPAVVSIDGVAVTAVGDTFTGAHGTLTITSLTATSLGYSYTLEDNTDGDNTFDSFAVLVTDADGDEASGTLQIDIVDDVPHAVDFDGTLLNEPTQVLSGLIDYGLGADGFGDVALTFDGASSNGSSIALTSNGDAVSVESVDTDSDGLQEVLGFIDSGPAGYDAGDHLVFSLAPTMSGEAYGEYALTLSDVLDLPREPINLSFSGIDAGGPQPSIVVGSSLIISAVSGGGGNVSASNDFVGIQNGNMDLGEKIKYAFGTVVGEMISAGDETFINDLRLDVKHVGSAQDAITYTVTNTVTGQTENGTLSIDDNAGLSNPIQASFDFNQVEITVTQGSFKIGGIQYTQFGEAEDILMAFSYTATDGDTDAVSGDFSVTVTDDAGAMTALAPGAGDFAAIINTSQDQMTV
jgi:VCBS repeat-containing protein